MAIPTRAPTVLRNLAPCFWWAFGTLVRSGLVGFQAFLNSLLKQQFAGAAGGFDHGLDQGDTELALFQFQNAVDGATGGSGDRVLQLRGMLSGFQHHAGGAFHGLRGQQSSDIARQANLYAGFGQRFENDVGEGRTAGGESSDRVHIFFIDYNRAAHGVEHGARNFQVLRTGVGAAAYSGHTASDGGGGIGHSTDHRHLFLFARAASRSKVLFQVAGGDRRGDGDDQRLIADFRRDLFQHFGDDLGLYA